MKSKFYGIKYTDLQNGNILYYGKNQQRLIAPNDSEKLFASLDCARIDKEIGDDFRFIPLDEEKIEKYGFKTAEECNASDHFINMSHHAYAVVEEEAYADVVELDPSMEERINYTNLKKEKDLLDWIKKSARKRNADDTVTG